MESSTFYTTGAFAKKANVSIRTIRFYDKQGILKPSHISESGYRLYTDADFAKLQKVLTLKYLGFSLEEIMDITVNDDDEDYVRSSLALQLELVKKKRESLQVVEEALTKTQQMLEGGAEGGVNWQRMLHLIHMISMERSLVEQYKNSANIRTRIGLHQRFATNPESWFSWVYRNLNVREGMTVLELGCGNGELWRTNAAQIPACKLLLSDISAGMLADAKDNLPMLAKQCTFLNFDCTGVIPLPDASCDIVVANHLLFYLKDIEPALKEVKRVLKKDGVFYASTYGREHMKEISLLAKEFDSRVTLSEVALYDIFGLENGREILGRAFPKIELLMHEDSLKVTEVQPILDYILSCYGNQHEYLNERYAEFREFVEKKLKTKGYLKITKQAGMFRCTM